MTHLPRPIAHQRHIRAALLPWPARLPSVGLWEGLSSHACLTCVTGWLGAHVLLFLSLYECAT